MSQQPKAIFPKVVFDFNVGRQSENVKILPRWSRGGSLQHPFTTFFFFVSGPTIERLTQPQTKAGPSISKSRPIPRLCTTKHEPKLTKLHQVLFN